jgi:hypothetical protein
MGFVIYQASQPIPKSTAAPTITISNLIPNQKIELGFQELDGNQVPDRIELRADLTSTQYAEITFAVRESGTERFTPIGVDDNLPYRVFYDGSIWPDGTQLDFIAVVNALNSHFSSALLQGIAPLYQRPTKPGAEASAYEYAVVHYQRSDNDYGDPAASETSAYWGLHL